jgi:hypothetical protein
MISRITRYGLLALIVDTLLSGLIALAAGTAM